MEANLRGKRKPIHLWKRQGGLRPVRNQKITKVTGWPGHHIVWRSRGGADGAENRVPPHPNCHRQVHSQGLDVAKPRSATGV
jgi:RNA-directed DNA polymerase